VESWNIFTATIAKDSPTIIVLLCFFAFWVWNARYIVTPAAQGGKEMWEKLMSDVIKPMIPVANGVMGFLEVQGRASEAQARYSQQMVDVMQDSTRITRELFEARFVQEKKEREEQTKMLQDRVKVLEQENTKLLVQNADLKKQVQELEDKLAIYEKEKTDDAKGK
jgi:hypothetical protein